MKFFFKRFIIILLAISVCIPIGVSGRRRRIPVVDINRDSSGAFEQLPGVDSSLAASIVEIRQEKQLFDSTRDILEAEGMSQEIFDEISPYLTMTSPDMLQADDILEDLRIMEEEEEEYFRDMDVDISRLELYRNNPLDLNTAVYSQLLELPGIGRDEANAIIDLRREMRGLSAVEDIRDIVGPESFEMISPFVALLDEVDLARIHGDVRVSADTTYPYHDYYFDQPEEYQKPLQIEARHRLNYGNKLEFGVNMRRKASPHWPPDYDGAKEINYANFNDYFLGSRYLLVRNVGLMDTVILGSYRIDYLRPFTRTRQMRGLRIDDRPAINAGFYGAAAEMRTGDWELTAFASEKDFAVDEINEYDGSVGVRPGSFYDTANYPIFKYPYLTETVYGGVVRRPLGGVMVGVGGYTLDFDRVIDNVHEEDEVDFTHFRGDGINIVDLEAEYRYRNYRFIADIGFSRYHTFDVEYDEQGYRDWEAGRDWSWETGQAYRFTVMSSYEDMEFWGYYWNVDHDYYDYLGEGRLATFNGRNEQRYAVGGRIEPTGNFYAQPELIYQEKLKLTRAGTDDWRSRLTFRLRQGWDFTDTLGLRYTGTVREADTFRSQEVRFSPSRNLSHRLQITHRPSDRLRLTGVFRSTKETYEDISELRDYDTSDGNYAELRYRITDPLILLSRIFVEGDDMGFMVRPVITFSRNSRLRMEYEYNPDGASSDDFSIQYDMSW